MIKTKFTKRLNLLDKQQLDDQDADGQNKMGERKVSSTVK